MPDRTAAIRFDEVVPARLSAGWRAPLSFTIPEGAFFVLRTTVERSSALMRVCTGLGRVASGRAEVLGDEPAALTRRGAQRFRRALGVALMPHGLLSNLTLRMNVVMPLVYGGLALPAEAAARAEEALGACGIAQWANERPADAPPDARQRAAIARAVVRDPALLLLEDPTWSIDADAAAELLALCRARAGTVVVTQPRRDATVARLADGGATWDDAGFRTESLS